MEIVNSKNIDDEENVDIFNEISIEQIEAREEMGCICSTDFWGANR